MFVPRGGGSCDPPWRAYHHRIAAIKVAAATTALIITSATSRAVGFSFALTFTFTFILPPPFCLYYNILIVVCQALFTEFSNNLQKISHKSHNRCAIMLLSEKQTRTAVYAVVLLLYIEV